LKKWIPFPVIFKDIASKNNLLRYKLILPDGMYKVFSQHEKTFVAVAIICIIRRFFAKITCENNNL
jgi:hypothetical protein